MSQRLFNLCLTLALTATSLFASSLRVDDPTYRGAFTILAAGRLEGATANYWTEVMMNNESDHAVYLRLELYPVNGPYRETVLDLNAVEPTLASGFQWGWIRRGIDPNGNDAGLGPDMLSLVLGENEMGALRVVAVHKDGTDDLTAVIHGSGRLWIEPRTGGRMSEAEPGFTDYEIGGARRGQTDANGYLYPGSQYSVYFRPIHVPGTRMAVVLTNFSDHDMRYGIGETCSTNEYGIKRCRDGIDFDVPAHATRRIPVAEIDQAWFQTLAVGSKQPSREWAAYITFTDNITNDSLLLFDSYIGSLSIDR